MDTTSINPSSTYGMNDKEQYLWNQLDEAERVTDLDLDVFDDVEIDYSLPDNVPAATQHSGNLLYDNTTLKVNENFFYLPEDAQRHTLIHEGLHGNMFNNNLENQLEDIGLSDESIDFFNSKLSSSEGEMEGATEYLTQLLDPNSDKLSLRSYPYETQKVRKDAEREGLDVESEIAKDIESYTDSILEEHLGHEVHGMEVGPNYTVEHGEVSGVPYSRLEIYEEISNDEPLGEGDSDLVDDIQEYMEDITEKYDAIAEYLTETDYDLEYGEGANHVGNMDQEHEVPLSASMGTPVNGNIEAK